jgi:hypothetical protein
VVEVRVTGQQDLDVAELEPELLDVAGHHRRHLLRARVEEDVPFGRGDEIGRDVLRPDIMDVAHHPERLHGGAPRAMDFLVVTRRLRRTARRNG